MAKTDLDNKGQVVVMVEDKRQCATSYVKLSGSIGSLNGLNSLMRIGVVWSITVSKLLSLL